jgi:hypothetical protein
VLKNVSCACVVVNEEIDTTTVRVDFKIMKGGDGRAAVVQPAASGASVSAESNVTACASDSSDASPGSYKPTVLKNDSCACVVVHEEIDTTTIRVDFKIINGGDGRAVAATAVIQFTASGASSSTNTVLSINYVSNVYTAFTAATCITKAVPRNVPVSISCISFIFNFENRSGR